MLQQVNRKHVAIGAVVLLTLLAGCLNATVETTVTSDGEIEETEIEMEFTDSFVWELFQDQADEEGFDDLGEFFAADLAEDEDEWDSIETSTDPDEETVQITATGGTDDGVEDVDITVDEEAGEVTYVDTDAFDEEEQDDAGDFDFGDDDFEFTYTVNMPGEIVETNGDVQADGASVQWTNEEHDDLSAFEVTSEQTGAESDDGSGPGFGVVAGVLALGLAAVVGIRQRRADG